MTAHLIRSRWHYNAASVTFDILQMLPHRAGKAKASCFSSGKRNRKMFGVNLTRNHPASADYIPARLEGPFTFSPGRLCWLRGLCCPVSGAIASGRMASSGHTCFGPRVIVNMSSHQSRWRAGQSMLLNFWKIYHPSVQRGKCLKFKNNLIEYLIRHQRPKLGRLTHGNERPAWPA